MKYATRDDLNTWMEMFDAKILMTHRCRVHIRMMIENVEFEFTFKTIEHNDIGKFIVDNHWNCVSYDDNSLTYPYVARGKGSRNYKLRDEAKNRLAVLFN